MRHRVAGFTMVEVLVAVLLLAVGLVGALAMQAHAMRTRQDSALLTEALQAAATLAERMRANGAQASAYVGYEFDMAHDAPAGSPPGIHAALDCSDAPCSPAALAQRELEEFRRQLVHALPSARAAICRDAGTPADGHPQWRCSDGADAPVVIKIGWRRRTQVQANAASGAAATGAAATGPAVVLPVALLLAPAPAPAPAPGAAPGGPP
jgi:type IV pilus assembly protein PilV